MKKLIVFIIICLGSFLLTGCSSKGLLNELPKISCESYESHRAGNFSSSHIYADGVVVTDDKVGIEKLRITADYGPFVNFNIIIKGYSRIRTNDVKDVQNE